MRRRLWLVALCLLLPVCMIQVACQALPLQDSYYVSRGDAFYAAGDLQQALSHYSAAITLNPDNAVAYQGRGLAYALSGNPRQAVEDFTRVIELDPSGAEAYNGRGLARCLL